MKNDNDNNSRDKKIKDNSIVIGKEEENPSDESGVPGLSMCLEEYRNQLITVINIPNIEWPDDKEVEIHLGFKIVPELKAIVRKR